VRQQHVTSARRAVDVFETQTLRVRYATATSPRSSAAMIGIPDGLGAFDYGAGMRRLSLQGRDDKDDDR